MQYAAHDITAKEDVEVLFVFQVKPKTSCKLVAMYLGCYGVITKHRIHSICIHRIKSATTETLPAGIQG